LLEWRMSPLSEKEKPRGLFTRSIRATALDFENPTVKAPWRLIILPQR
jgi:hypothetical protein